MKHSLRALKSPTRPLQRAVREKCESIKSYELKVMETSLAVQVFGSVNVQALLKTCRIIYRFSVEAHAASISGGSTHKTSGVSI